MRISDWSSDVCSSDLLQRRVVAAESSSRVAQDQLQMLRREKRELQRRITLLQDDVRKAEEAVSKSRMVANEEAGRVEALRRENVLDAEHASSWEKREKTWQKEREDDRSEEHTSELQTLMRHSYAVFCLKKK